MDNLWSLITRKSQFLVRLSFILILLGYFLVWLPQPAAGLSFIGLEMAEWVKFLPKVQAGDLLPSRNFFYLPPTTLAVMLALWTAGWPNNRWRTWIARGLAILISLLAVPALESIQGEPVNQWLIRFFFIALAGAAVLGAAYYSGKQRLPESVPWSYFVFFGAIGSLLPLWSYLAIAPSAEEVLGGQVSLGIGLILNLIGHGLIMFIGFIYLIGFAPTVDMLAAE